MIPKATQLFTPINHIRVYPFLLTVILCALFFLPSPSKSADCGGSNPIYKPSPTKIPENKASTLFLGPFSSCTDVIHSSEAKVNGNHISLQILHTKLTGVACPLVISPIPYGPVFELPPLPKGSYTLSIQITTSCGTEKKCPECITQIPLTDTLYVQSLKEFNGWLITADSTLIPPDTLQFAIRNPQLGSCNNFARGNNVYEAAPQTLSTVFFHKVDSSRQCITDVYPWGPTFRITGLKKNTSYKVFHATYPDCAYCPDEKSSLNCCKIVLPLPEYIGSLTVPSSYTSLKPITLSAPTPSIRMKNGYINLNNWAGPSPQAYLYYLDGSRFQSIKFTQDSAPQSYVSNQKIKKSGLILRVFSEEHNFEYFLP